MTATSRREGLVGVYNIVTTPFHPDGSLDLGSLRRLLGATVTAGVDGVTLLGIAGEAKKLSYAERRRVIETGFETVAGRVKVVVGTSEDGTDPTIAACLEAEADGAAGVMVAPPTFVGPGPALTEHYRRIGDAVGIPIVLQDAPPETNGVTMSPADLAGIVAAVPRVTTIKLEGLPTPGRTAQTLDLTGDEVTILGALGGLYLLNELRSGSHGVMTGFAYPEILVSIWRSWSEGDEEGAAETYYRYLPMMVCEGPPGGLAMRKHALMLRGLIDHDTVRGPSGKLHPKVLDQVARTIQDLELDTEFPLQAASQRA
jgi:4-hydroxy-tetrahydrodipicolinate synthase